MAPFQLPKLFSLFTNAFRKIEKGALVAERSIIKMIPSFIANHIKKVPVLVAHDAAL